MRRAAGYVLDKQVAYYHLIPELGLWALQSLLENWLDEAAPILIWNGALLITKTETQWTISL